MIDFFKALIILLVTLPVRIVFLIAPFIPLWIADKRVPVIDTADPMEQSKVEIARLGKRLVRSRLPSWLSWFDTPDQTLPGGMYEPSVADLFYKTESYTRTAAYWIGVRNVMHGFAWKLGKPAPDWAYENINEADRKKCGLYRVIIPLGIVQLFIGHKIYRDWYSVSTENAFWAIPVITVNKRDRK